MAKGVDKIKIYQQTSNWIDTVNQIVCDPKLLRPTTHSMLKVNRKSVTDFKNF